MVHHSHRRGHLSGSNSLQDPLSGRRAFYFLGAFCHLGPVDRQCSDRLPLSAMAPEPLVPNKISFVTWLTFVSVCALASLSGLVWIFVPNYSDSLKQERERVLRQDLLLMRSLISQYTLDKKQRPHSLHDMAAAGYLKNVPRDPFTGRNDTWIVKCSSDLSTPGIVGIESGYGNATNNAAHECD